MEIDAQKFDRIARSLFAPVYPVIAGQINARTGVTRGICLDIGRGGGYLGAATRARFETVLETAGIASYIILYNEDIGLWLIMRK
jgi:hypothetical protein